MTVRKFRRDLGGHAEVGGATDGEPSTVAVIDPRDQLVLDEARRGIDQQKKDLEGLRVRAAATVGFSTVTASVLGGFALRDSGRMTEWTWSAFVFLALVALLCIYVLAPRTLTLVMDVKKMDAWIGDGDDIGQMMRSTSLGYDEEYCKNDKVLRRMHGAYATAILAVLIQVVLLFVDLAGR